MTPRCPSEQTYRALLRFVTVLHSSQSRPQLERLLTEGAAGVVPADLVTLNRINTKRMGASITMFAPEFVSPKAIEPAFDKYVHQHPLVQEIARTGDGRPRRMSDYISVEDFRRTDLYEHVFKPLRSQYQIGFSVSMIDGTVVGIGINRTSEDFTDEELDAALMLWEQIPAAFHHVQLRELHARETQVAVAAELTDREREILVYLRAGMGNQEIAQALIIGRRTVEKHLERLYGKLGVRNRSAAVNAVWPASAGGPSEDWSGR
jgi:DNA-binding CsgD family transcriptional regulator